eukprot:jgi/Tetstr1/456682/TSEL_043383.t1
MFMTGNSDTNTLTHGFFEPQLVSALGRGSFDATSSVRQYDHFLINVPRGSASYAAAVREVWRRIRAATVGHLSDADAREKEREAEAAPGSQKELISFLASHASNNSCLQNISLVGLPEHVWPALHAFRTSIKASVGLEVRFDKMQVYIADMEAVRRKYVHAYMRGKAEELREEMSQPEQDPICQAPPSVEAFAEAVDATVLTAVERVLGVSFDPSTYGTDTNPVVTDFQAELLMDPGRMAAHAATLSEDAVAKARTLHLFSRERILFIQLDAASGMWMVAIPISRTVMTPHELRESLLGTSFA